MTEEMLGEPADHIEILEGQILLETTTNGWLHGVCVCGVKMSSESRPTVEDWAKFHAKRCEKEKR